jgi:hypothetical protein
LLDRINPTIEEITAAVEREARNRPEALRLMTHPGVGPITALAYVLIQLRRRFALVTSSNAFPHNFRIADGSGAVPLNPPKMSMSPLSEISAPTSAAEDLAEHHIEVIECSGAVTCKARAMHDGERFGLQVGELFQVLRGEWCVGNIIRKDARLKLLHRLMRAPHDIGRGERFDVAHVMEQVRT